jgi:hypothetical protein
MGSGVQARAREGRWGYFLYKRGVAAANQREGYNGRRGDGDKTTFGHTQSGRHKYAKASRRRELRGRYTFLIKTMSLYGELGRGLRSH